MTWYAKPKGAYAIDSAEAQGNMDEIRNLCSSRGWSLEAICGMLGNMVNESGLNPWRWQSDRVNYSNGYGLPQFTPASGYFNDYGVGTEGYAPNRSTSTTTSGASPSDGYAQIIVIDEDKAGKFLNRQSYCSYWDISSCYPLSAYKQVTDLYTATVGWLFNYEFPTDHSQSVANTRYQSAVTCYQYLSGHDPNPPDPPTPGGNRNRIIGIGLRRRKAGRIV